MPSRAGPERVLPASVMQEANSFARVPAPLALPDGEAHRPLAIARAMERDDAGVCSRVHTTLEWPRVRRPIWAARPGRRSRGRAGAGHDR